MRPDLDEYEDLNTDEGEPKSRTISWLVLGVAVIGFGALAYYAYKSGSQSAADGQMVTVEAEPGAIKEAPADPGGEQFPHKDKTIYDALSPYRAEEQPVEKLLPEPEEPVMPEPAASEEDASVTKSDTASSYVNDRVDDKSKTDLEPVGEAKPAPVPKPMEAVEVKDAPLATKPTQVVKAPEPTQVIETPKPAPAPVKEEDITPLKTPEPVAAAPKPTPKPEAAATKPTSPVKTVSAGGDYKIQLGAYGSDSEARQMWSKVTAKHGDIVSGSPIIVKADVNGKTYYRLRATGFGSADAAKRACATLSGRGQGCFPAGK